VRAAHSDYESLITVTVAPSGRSVSVSGTVYCRRQWPRLVASRASCRQKKNAPPIGKSMIYVTNEDNPGFIGAFAGLLGDAKLTRDVPSRP